ncbi:MAG: radical SAM protein [Muribaculaceae bacterium]|nr:radical SAM protein [Muribaculaceae bacterium]
MNIYRQLKFFTRIKSRPVKLFGIWLMHKLRKRYIGVFLDPVMGCNLRCRMCYMSDPESSKKYRDMPRQGRLMPETLDYIADNFFSRAVKLQIGCATEPTLYPDLPSIIRRAKESGVPYISITTNGQLLTEDSLREMIRDGLNEVTLSVHGFEKEVYEDMMRGARFDKFLALMLILKKMKKEFPDFKVRMNYVMNKENTRTLARLYDVLDGLHLDVIQLRPVQDVGGKEYSDYSLDVIRECYDDIIAPIRERCIKEATVCICPNKENLDSLEEEFDPMVDYMEQLTYYYMFEGGINKEGFDWKEESFDDYHRRKHTASDIRRSIFNWKRKADAIHSSRKLNYEIK